ncbi:hypothetical protein ZPAH1_orf00372 [Aeromonas phage ZPAH1]|nr:hypothetical protein ZPAH1_orf00372 [Aeromonas phage ZPAH1]
MNITLNDIVSRITIGHYTLKMKDGSTKYVVRRQGKIIDLDTNKEYYRTEFQMEFGDDLVSLEYGVESDDFNRWKHLYEDRITGTLEIDGDTYRFETKNYYTDDMEDTYVDVFLYHQVPWNGSLLVDTFESLKDSVSKVRIHC